MCIVSFVFHKLQVGSATSELCGECDDLTFSVVFVLYLCCSCVMCIVFHQQYGLSERPVNCATMNVMLQLRNFAAAPFWVQSLKFRFNLELKRFTGGKPWSQRERQRRQTRGRLVNLSRMGNKYPCLFTVFLLYLLLYFQCTVSYICVLYQPLQNRNQICQFNCNSIVYLLCWCFVSLYCVNLTRMGTKYV